LQGLVFSSWLRFLFIPLLTGARDTLIFQAVNDVDASQERLLDLCDRIGSFFKRLEAYMEVPPTAAMMDIFIKIMTELLSVLAIATVEMKRGRMGG
jgi:hypothetical protein